MAVTGLMGAELAAPFERATEADAAAIARAHWGLTVRRVVRVDTERDDTFHVEAAPEAGSEGKPAETSHAGYALKLAHPTDDRAVIELQLAAIEWAAERDPALPLPRPIAALDGTFLPVAGERIARLSRWMPGTSLRDALAAAAPTPALLHAIGATQARLTVALERFAHPADGRVLAWDVAELAGLRGLIEAVDDPAPVEDALDRFVRDVAPRLADLPRQVIHNDGNLDNLLVEGYPVHSGFEGPSFESRVHEMGVRVAAILDFGDVVRTTRVLDLAVTASYLLPTERRFAASDALAGLATGWESILELEPLERELLPRLVVGRLVQRILLGSWLAREMPHNAAYLGRNIAHTRAQLSGALAEGF